MNKRILALDLSTKSSGWAVYLEQGVKPKCGTITSSSADLQKRIGIMREGVIDLIKKYDIEEVIVEEVRPDGYNTKTAKALMWLQGCIDVAIFEYNKKIKVNFIGVSTWRKVLGIKQGRGVRREEQKILDIEYANNELGFNFAASEDDAADAVCILAAYLKDAKSLSISEIKPTEKLDPIGSGASAF